MGDGTKMRKATLWDPNGGRAVEVFVPDDGTFAPGEQIDTEALRPVVVVFDAPPGPGNECVFVEVEDLDGSSVGTPAWRERPDGYWQLGPFLVVTDMELKP